MTDQTQLPEFLQSQTFCIIDLETTGGNHKYDKIIEVGLVKVVDLEIVDELSFLVKPEINIPDFIQKLTSITPDKLVDAPIIDDVIEDVLKFIENSILVAHNSSFDVPFLNSVLHRLGKPKLENRVLCTNLMSKYLIPNILNSNLNYMSRIFGIDHNKAHRALEDAMATSHLLIRFLKIFIDKGINKINHLYYPRNKYELDRVHYNQGEEVDKIIQTLKTVETPVLMTFKGEKGVLINSFPLENPSKQIDQIMDYINSKDWQIMTTRLYGSILEAILDTAVNFTKFQSDGQAALLSFLQKNYIKEGQEIIPADTGPKGIKSLSKKLPHFVIINHLIPEQLVIYPLLNLNSKAEMIFRFPGHQKKIFQYIKNQHKRFKFNLKGHRRALLPKDLLDFVNTYLLQNFEREPESQDFLFFNMDKNTKDHESFASIVREFSAKNPNTYNYPNKHI
jgi:DNA polymerase-3 subunit alpha (Gram-positive type)